MNNQELNKQFWRFLWSSILVALSGCLGNVVDAIIVGNLISADGVSAINLTKPVTQFMFTINMLLAGGAGMLVGIALGKQDLQRTRYIYTLSCIGNIGIGGLLLLIGLLIPDTVTALLLPSSSLHLPPSTLHLPPSPLFTLTENYLMVMLLGAPVYMALWLLSMMVGVDGSPRLVSIAILVDNAVNLGLDFVFISLFDWGIAGSSAATVVGHAVGILIMTRHFFYKDNHLLLAPCPLPLAPEWMNIISQGAPLAIASISLTLLLFAANSIVLSTVGRTGIFVFSVCMNLLQIYNLFLSGTCRTLQSLGSIQVGKGDGEAFRFILRKSFRFITIAMLITCVFVWIDPQTIARTFGAEEPDVIVQTDHALRVFALSFIPFCYIYVLMIVYKLYAQHRMALFISFALSLTVIPVLWIVARVAPGYIWYSYLLAYMIEIVMILVLHKVSHIRLRVEG